MPKDRSTANEYNGDDKTIVPVSFATPEVRCACAEERIARLLDLGLTPKEIISFITLSEPCNDERELDDHDEHDQ